MDEDEAVFVLFKVEEDVNVSSPPPNQRSEGLRTWSITKPVDRY